MSKLIPSTTEFYVGPAPVTCNACRRNIGTTFVDANLPGIGWCNACPSCFKANGGKLGTGRGQAYKWTIGSRWAKLVPATEAKPSRKKPSIATLERWSNDGVAKSTDGCKVEPDGICSHGTKSWLLELGYI